MSDSSTNPVIMALLFILRCLVPLGVLFGISYLLRKMGVVATETPEPPDDREEEVVALPVPEKPAPPKAEVKKSDTGRTASKKPVKTKPKTSGKSPGKRKPVEKSRSRSK